MKTKQEPIEKKVKAFNATISPFDTGEVWIDKKKGNKYNIERAPIDWRRIAEVSRGKK